jgi:hypothetical protein
VALFYQTLRVERLRFVEALRHRFRKRAAA